MNRILLAIAVALLAVAQPGKRDAAKLFGERKYAESARLLETHLRRNPKDFSSHMLLGLSYQQLGEFGKAQSSFESAAGLQPAHSGARYALARVLFFMGRFDEALAMAAAAGQLGEPAPRIHHLRGRIEEERGKFAAALEEYRRAIALDRTMVEAISGEASVLYKLRRYVEGRSAAEAALRLDPASPEAKRVLARISGATALRASGAVQPVRFVKQNAIPFRLQHFPTEEKHLISTMIGGLAVFDFDNDGLVDIFFANGAEVPSLRKTGPKFWNRLYRNAGNWRFEDVTEAQGLGGEGFAMGAAAADFDGDGRTDLFVPGVRRNLLYRNTERGFIEVSRKAGIRDEVWSVAGAWLDYDADGFLDLFVVNYLDWKPEAERYCGDRSKDIRVYCHPREYRGLPNRLYRNRGDGTFQDVSERAGISRHIGKGMSAAVIDADGDGRPDIFVTNDTQANFLFRNLGGGRFAEAALQFGVGLNEEGNPISSMGVDARDYDNDGLPDLIVTALTGENFPLFRNTGKGAFADATYPSGIGIAAARRSGWGVALADLNNDGWKDIITANSHVTDNVEQLRNERYREPNTIFVNREGSFAPAQEVGPSAAHRGLVTADLDNDGRLDAVVTVLGETPELWRNETEGGNWVRVELEGRSIGARVRIGTQWQERTSATGYASSSLHAVHFGIGAEASVREIEIRWPSGVKQTITDVKAGETVTVREQRDQRVSASRK